MIKFILILFCSLVFVSCAKIPPPQPEPPKASQAYLQNLACRIFERGSAASEIRVLSDVNIDTTSDFPARHGFSADIHEGRVLSAQVRHVKIGLPRDRFHVTLNLDGARHFRTNHMDLDIYLETVIDGRTYGLHCFPEIE